MKKRALNFELIGKEVHAWIVNLVDYPIPVNTSILSKEELDRAEKFKLPEPKRTYLHCRYALRILLGYYLNMEPEHLEFAYNPFGKPFLRTNNQQNAIHFNLSHCKNVGSIVITKNSAVGVDVEKMDSSLLELVNTFMAREEIESFNSFRTNKEIILYHLWVQKEAILKAKGTGMQALPTNVQGIVTPRINLRNEMIDEFYINTFQFHSNIYAICTAFKPDIKFFHFEDFIRQKQTKY